MNFIDTNIIVYAFDESEPRKSLIARKLIFNSIDSKEGCISTQVIQEFCNVALNKSASPLNKVQLKRVLSAVLVPLLSHKPDEKFYLRALDIYDRFSLSFYDSLIIQAATDINCSIVYSEDMQHGMTYGKTKVINPFI